MAEELKIKVRVDSSDVSRGTDEAKNKVKQAADSMKSNAANAASSMKASMDSVAKSTASIGDAAKSAANAVSDMDRGVARSAANMEKNLASVRRQMSAMQMFNMGARGIGIVSGIAQDIATLNGNKTAANSIGAASEIIGTGLQGAAIGYAMGGPWGAAIGGLVAAGKGLLDAAVKQKEAAESQLQSSKKNIEQIEADYQSRLRRERAQEIANMPEGAFDEKFAQGEIDKYKRALQIIKNHQALIQDMIYGRNGAALEIGDWGSFIGRPGQKVEYPILGMGEFPIDYSKLPKQIGPVNWMDPNYEKRIQSFLIKEIMMQHLEWRNSDESDTLWNNFNINLADYMAKLVGIDPLNPQTDIDKLTLFSDPWIASISDIVQDAPKNIFKFLESESRAAAEAVAEMERRIQELAPIQARLDKERAASEARMNAPLNFEDWGIEDIQDQSNFESSAAASLKLKDKLAELASGESIVKGLSARLAGLANFATSPTDALTKIGGGVGYTSYNNSVLTVTKSIEKSLNTLIANQLRQNEEIRDEIANLKLLEASWQ